MPKANKKTAGNAAIGKGAPGPGRPKGSVNKVTHDVRAMVLKALQDSGGVKYLAQQAKTNPTAFLTLVGKIVPKEVTGPNGEALFGKIRFIGVEVE